MASEPIKIEVDCPVHDSFRVQQVAGMFDVPLAERSTQEFEFELPGEDEDWSIGLIVGPSGSGKSTVAQHAFGESLQRAEPWPVDSAVIDGFGDTPVREVVRLFTAVGFGSPPSWVKPYHVLSGGERFRCDLARALAMATGGGGAPVGKPPGTTRPCTLGTGASATRSAPATQQSLVAFDEFTSVVDRNVARVCSAAIAKGIRGGAIPCRFVAVTCHYDVAEWLEPDWVLDTATGRLTRRRLRRPPIELQIHRCGLDAWRLFARHHYLTGTLAKQSRCYLASWNGEPVAFAALLPILGQKGRRRFTRIVTLPDYQGVGVGSRTIEAVADLERARGMRVNVTSSHPGLIGHCQRSPRWRTVAVRRTGSTKGRKPTAFSAYRSSAGRAVVSFEYLGKPTAASTAA